MKKITKENCISKAELDQAIMQYFVKEQFLSESHAQCLLEDFEEPYDCLWIEQYDVDECTIDGKEYEVRACLIECYMSMAVRDVNRFRFYMLFCNEKGLETMDDYRAAERLYVIEPIDEDDFPGQVDIL